MASSRHRLFHELSADAYIQPTELHLDPCHRVFPAGRTEPDVSKSDKRFIDGKIQLVDTSTTWTTPTVGRIEEKRIEPALWFKVLVLDSVFVDHDARGLYWSRERTREAEHMHQLDSSRLDPMAAVKFFTNKEKVFEDTECYDFEANIDEMFDTAAHIVQDYHSQSSEELPTEAGCSLLRLLHVFILPVIKFHSQDRQAIVEVRMHIERHQEEIERTIQLKGKSKQNTEKSLKRQRESLLATGNFSGQQGVNYIAACDVTFLTFFLEHLEKDIKRTNEHLIGLERQIELSRDSHGDTRPDALQTLRSGRNSTYEFIEKCITAREAIKNVISRPHVKKNIKLITRTVNEPFHDLYTEITKGLSKLNKEIQELINNKIHISSVRESVYLTLHEINTDGESYGYQRKAGTYEMDANIYDPKCMPDEWSTLAEKVANLLKGKQFGFQIRNVKFCEMIQAKIHRILDESKLFSIGTHDTASIEPVSPDTANLLQNIGMECRDRRPISRQTSTKSPTSAHAPVSYASRWSLGSISRSEVVAVSEEVVRHIWEVSVDMAREFTLRAPVSTTYVNKVYVCYEYHVSQQLMPLLCELFEYSYREQCESLKCWLSRVSLSDLGFDDTKIAALMGAKHGTEQGKHDIAEIEEYRRVEYTDVKVPYCEPDDYESAKGALVKHEQRITLKSMNLNHITLGELYSSADAECYSMRESFEGALAMGSTGNEEASTGNGEEISVDPTKEVLQTSRPQYNVSSSRSIATTSHRTVGEEHPDYIGQCVEETVLSRTNSTATNVITEAIGNSEVRLRSKQSSTKTEPLAQHNVLPSTSISAQYEHEVLDGSLHLPAYDDVVCMREKYNDAPPAYSTLSPLHAKFYLAFERAESYINMEADAHTLFRKLKHITKLLRYIERELSRVREEGGSGGGVCADDLLDVATMIIGRLEAGMLLKLYANMNLMIQLSPRFMQGSAHEYALVTLNVAYQHLFEQHILHRSHFLY